MSVQEERLFNQLMEKLLEEEISFKEFQQLQDLIEGNRYLSRKYRDIMELHSDLMWDRVNQQPPEASEPKHSDEVFEKKKHNGNRPKLLYALAATVLLSFILGVLFWRPSGQEETASIRLLRQVSCQWNDADPKLEALPIGKSVVLKKGIAEVQFDSGDKVTLYSPAVFRMESPTRCVFQKGKFSVERNSKEQMEIATPAITAVYSKKNFAIDIRDSGDKKTIVSALGGGVRIIAGGKEHEIPENSIARLTQEGKLQLESLKESFYSVPRSFPQVSEALRKNMKGNRPRFAWSGRNGLWEDPGSWSAGEAPNQAASVRLSGGKRVAVQKGALAGEIFVGTCQLKIGKSASLKVYGLSGDFDIGFRKRPKSKIEVQGRLEVNGRVVLRNGSEFNVKDGQTKINSDFFILDPGCHVRFSGGPNFSFVANNLFGLSKNDQVSFESDSSGFPCVKIRSVVQIGGQLNLDGRQLTSFPEIMVLVNNQGELPVQGEFLNLREGATVCFNGIYYKITYKFESKKPNRLHRLNGNDIALLRIDDPV